MEVVASIKDPANMQGVKDLGAAGPGDEHNRAKVGVVGSNPIARSKHLNDLAAFGLTDTEA